MRSLWHLQLLACSLACSLGLHERLEGGQSWRTFWFSWLCCEATDGRAWERGMEIRLWELHRDAWAQSNSVQCLFWHNTPTRKTCWLLLWCELLVPERAPCRKILRGNMKQGCSQEAHVPRRSLEYRKDYSNCPPSCRLGSRRSQRSSVNQPLNKSSSLLLEKILFWAGFRTNKCIHPLECRDSSDFCEMASYPLPKQALCKAVANGFTNETSWETIAMFNRQCDA